MIRLSLFILLISIGALWPTNANSSQKHNSTELQLLADLSPTSCHFSGTFSQQKNVKGLPVPLLSTGDFFFSCDLGLIWNTLSPFSEALLYINASNNFRIDDKGNVEALSGVAHYSMSKIFLKLLKGDTQYFADAFSVVLIPNSDTIELTPESSFMKKGIEHIHFNKNKDEQGNIQLEIRVMDITGQMTKVEINNISEFDISGKRQAFEQCEKAYPSPLQWCKGLRSPLHFQR
ncbi:outer membrane lipoprotein carrier protein LolA [Alteromonas sp. 5E99-2]|uniref:LolA family protein n=1 Tax=Alteromonas sp. 5E99-2 TaxID=2817683 RepID=UPI001A9842B9|nr:outer membrane lipoprotein carrier protein LolA [Alteromonas sp. 5E99-2]MBO1256751.1 outer membrane lipoprotein carrier protein LolA [Alteromonas sp. 5E99-2]